VMGCGKTTTLRLLQPLVSRGRLIPGLTEAALLRFSPDSSSVLLADEIRDREVRNVTGALIIGWSNPATILRARFDGNKEYNVWFPKVIARIGRFPEEVEDRSIIINLSRMLPTETRERVGSAAFALAAELGAAGRELAEHYRAKLADANPSVPPSFQNRAKDNVTPLLTVADAAGGHWPQTARQAALTLIGVGEQPLEIILLADIRAIFDRLSVPRVSTDELLAELAKLGERPWSSWPRFSAALSLAKLLRQFNIQPRQINSQVRGYFRSDMEDAFLRYPMPT